MQTGQDAAGGLGSAFHMLHLADAVHGSDTQYTHFYRKFRRSACHFNLALWAVISGESALRYLILDNQFLLLEGVDHIAIWLGSCFFALQPLFQFGMFCAKGGNVIVAHLILLILV